MSVIYLTLSVSFILAVGFLIGFIWAAKNNQYDDYDTPSIRMLFDDEFPTDVEQNNTTKSK